MAPLGRVAKPEWRWGCHCSTPGWLQECHSQILSSIVFLVPSGLPFRVLNLYRTEWALACVCFTFFVYFIFFVSGCVCYIKLTTHTAFQSTSTEMFSGEISHSHIHSAEWCSNELRFAVAFLQSALSLTCYNLIHELSNCCKHSILYAADLHQWHQNHCLVNNSHQISQAILHGQT